MHKYSRARNFVRSTSPTKSVLCKKSEVKKSPQKNRIATAKIVIEIESTRFARNAFRTPLWSPFPKNCAAKIPPPLIAPQRQRWYTKKSWFETLTAFIWSVPICPTIMLSKSETKFEIVFWIMIGITMKKTFL